MAIYSKSQWKLSVGEWALLGLGAGIATVIWGGLVFDLKISLIIVVLVVYAVSTMFTGKIVEQSLWSFRLPKTIVKMQEKLTCMWVGTLFILAGMLSTLIMALFIVGFLFFLFFVPDETESDEW